METILTKIVNNWSESGFIEKSDEEIYVYGLDLLIFTILNMLAILITSVIINRFTESAILLATIIPLQSYGGGYHAKTHLRCFLIMYIGWWGLMYIIPFITSLVAFVMSVISVVIIFCLAPVPHKNVKMSTEHRLKLRTVIRIISLSIGLLSVALLLLFSNYHIQFGVLLSTGLGVTAFSMVVAHIVNKIHQNQLSKANR